jgi:hypothetical protein
VATYREARRAERQGKPLAAVEAKPEAKTDDTAAVQTPEQVRTVSKRQQQINDYERRIAEQEIELARLRTLPVPVRTEAAAPARPAENDPEPDPNDTEKYPGGEYDAKYLRDAARWDVRNELRARDAQAQTRAQLSEVETAQRARVSTFVERLNQAKAADPTFAGKLTKEVRALEPFDALPEGQPGGPLNVLAEQIFDSPLAPVILLHLSQHPEALKHFESLPPEIATLPPALRAKAHIPWIVREFGKLEARLESPSPAPVQPKTITSSPTPPTTLGTRPGSPADPKLAAVAQGDVRGYRAARRAERVAQRV